MTDFRWSPSQRPVSVRRGAFWAGCRGGRPSEFAWATRRGGVARGWRALAGFGGRRGPGPAGAPALGVPLGRASGGSIPRRSLARRVRVLLEVPELLANSGQLALEREDVADAGDSQGLVGERVVPIASVDEQNCSIGQFRALEQKTRRVAEARRRGLNAIAPWGFGYRNAGVLRPLCQRHGAVPLSNPFRPNPCICNIASCANQRFILEWARVRIRCSAGRLDALRGVSDLLHRPLARRDEEDLAFVRFATEPSRTC